jgi:allophanate hydrolase
MSQTAASGPTPGPTVAALLADYRDGRTTPADTVARLVAHTSDHLDDGTWISLVNEDGLAARAEVVQREHDPLTSPLYGVPFAVKDSIDVAGVPTTVACPEFAYVAERTAPAVRRLLDAGAIYVGKTNLDQFATGLNGTRSPYGLPRSVFGGDLISGGSSSGSALAVATGQVPFAVATDTAGSGRVPPALNGIPGFKPSRGLISTVGLVPACRSLDCLSLMAGSVADLATVFDVMAAFDPDDPYSRHRVRGRVPDPSAVRVGLPAVDELEFFGDTAMRAAHLFARARVAEHFEVTTVPWQPFSAAGELLYQGPWVAERLAEFGEFVDAHPDSVLPVIRDILTGGRRYSAVEVFAAEHRLGELRVAVGRWWRRMDVLVVPVLGTTFTVGQILADPIGTNTTLGYYTHCGNLLDLCAAVVPAGLTTDGRPSALMVLGAAGSDDLVLAVAGRLAGEFVEPELVPESAFTDVEPVALVVVGHHLSGQPRNVDLLARGAVLAELTRTAASYRLIRVGTDPPVPALVRVEDGGTAIEVETWLVPADSLAPILAGSSAAVCLGRVELADGRTEIGFVADPSIGHRSDVEDISAFGGWRNYLSAVSLS